jgi:riboflavin kinase/FMN adenylyltransferase
MRILAEPRELDPAPRQVCLAIGVFDGVHLGHQEVIRQTLADARECGGVAVVITFDRHPAAIVAPDRQPRLIYSLPQKLRTLAQLGVDATWLVRFDAAFSRQDGETFVRRLGREFGRISSICIGQTFTFGHNRSGNVALLRRLGAELGFTVHGLPPVAWRGQPISSTRIREAIGQGDFAAAARMLGRPYALCATVVPGDGFGRELGFPTANLAAQALVLPPTGVYAAVARLEERTWPAAVNIGRRPTVARAEDRLHVEAHLLDFEGDLYGRELELTFVERLRQEQRFPSREALAAQIAQDVSQTRELLRRRAVGADDGLGVVPSEPVPAIRPQDDRP